MNTQFVADLALRHGLVRNTRTHGERLWALKLDIEAEVADRLETIAECFSARDDLACRAKQAIVGAINQARFERLRRGQSGQAEFDALVERHGLSDPDVMSNAAIVRALQALAEPLKASLVDQVLRDCARLPEVGYMKTTLGAQSPAVQWLEALAAAGGRPALDDLLDQPRRASPSL